MHNNLVKHISLRLNFTGFDILTAWFCVDTWVVEFSGVLQEVWGITEIIYGTSKPYCFFRRRAGGGEGIRIMEEGIKKLVLKKITVNNNSALIDDYI